MVVDFETFRGCLSKISLEQDLDQRQNIGAHLKSYCGSINCTSMNFKSTENEGQFYLGIAQG